MAAAGGGARATEISQELAARLTPAQQQFYLAYREARAQFDKQYSRLLDRIEAKRQARRARRMLGQAHTPDDYIATQPPQYLGPELTPDVARAIASLQPPAEVRQLPGVADFLKQAKEQFGFVPKVVAEREFKRLYARKSLRVGLTKEQVVRVYALETGGQGGITTRSRASIRSRGRARRNPPRSATRRSCMPIQSARRPSTATSSQSGSSRWPPSRARRQVARRS